MSAVALGSGIYFRGVGKYYFSSRKVLRVATLQPRYMATLGKCKFVAIGRFGLPQRLEAKHEKEA